MPISFNLLDEIAIAVLVRLKQATSKIRILIVADPITILEGGAAHVPERTTSA
jgi:hypothetical protein